MKKAIYVATQYQADQVMAQLFNQIAKCGSVTVGDLYQLVGSNHTYLDDGLGWTAETIQPAGVVKSNSGVGYMIDLPEPTNLSSTLKLKVWVVKHHQTDTWNPGAPYFCTVAISEDAAKRWIEGETKKGAYAQGPSYTPDWWIKYGTFSISEVEVFT